LIYKDIQFCWRNLTFSNSEFYVLDREVL